MQRRAERPWATLALTHGAGGGLEAVDLQALATRLPRVGITVALVEQPWRVAGRGVAVAPAALDEGFFTVAGQLRPRTPMVVGGRSAGARVACRTARSLGAAGVVALAFPLHPPGRPERSRVAELAGARVPLLVVQGERDSFGTPQEFPPGTTLVAVQDADHSFGVPRRLGTQGAALDAVVGAVTTWVRALLAPA